MTIVVSAIQLIVLAGQIVLLNEIIRSMKEDQELLERMNRWTVEARKLQEELDKSL